MAFKNLAVGIIKHPESEAGHPCISETVPLKKITTEAVAEALLNIYSRVGIPEEVLTDQGDPDVFTDMPE